MVRQIFSWTFTIAFFGVTCFIGFLVLTEYFDGKPEPEVYITDWQNIEYFALNDEAANTPVTILEFYDYQCIHCKKTAPKIDPH